MPGDGQASSRARRPGCRRPPATRPHGSGYMSAGLYHRAGHRAGDMSGGLAQLDHCGRWAAQLGRHASVIGFAARRAVRHVRQPPRASAGRRASVIGLTGRRAVRHVRRTRGSPAGTARVPSACRTCLSARRPRREPVAPARRPRAEAELCVVRRLQAGRPGGRRGPRSAAIAEDDQHVRLLQAGRPGGRRGPHARHPQLSPASRSSAGCASIGPPGLAQFGCPTAPGVGPRAKCPPPCTASPARADMFRATAGLAPLDHRAGLRRARAGGYARPRHGPAPAQRSRAEVPGADREGPTSVG